MSDVYFDLIEFQTEIRECSDVKKLFEKTNHLCWLYDHSKIGKYEYNEAMPLIKERFAILEGIKNQMKPEAVPASKDELAPCTIERDTSGKDYYAGY